MPCALGFRGRKVAASLKQIFVILQPIEYPRFRGRKVAASLKPEDDHSIS